MQGLWIGGTPSDEHTPTSGLFPFNFREGGRGVARIVIVKQHPAGSFGSARNFGRCGDGLSLGNQPPNVGGQFLQISALVAERARPAAHGPVAWNQPFRGDFA